MAIGIQASDVPIHHLVEFLAPFLSLGAEEGVKNLWILVPARVGGIPPVVVVHDHYFLQ